jgi:predicted glycosyltransferase
VRVIPFDPHIISTFANADVVICQGGYNTIAELTGLGRQTICVPAHREFDDQFERALSSAGSHAHMHPFRGRTHTELAKTIETCLNAKPISASSSVADGACRAADELHALVTRIRS